MDDYDELFAQALDLMQASRYPEAIVVWRQLSASLPEDEVEEQALVALNTAVCLAGAGQGAEAVQVCLAQVEQKELPLDGDLGQQLLRLIIEQSRLTGDLGQARAAGEKALAALEHGSGGCSPDTLVELAQQRAGLARDMGQPDDAEETLATVLEILTEPLGEEGLDSEERDELMLAKARILETRAHNRFEGHADEIASLDLEDAANICLQVLGESHEETQRVAELLRQVSNNY